MGEATKSLALHANCLQMLACVCHILALFDPNFRDLAGLIDCIADSVFMTVMGCMNAQVALELNHRMAGVGPGAPPGSSPSSRRPPASAPTRPNWQSVVPDGSPAA